MSANIDMSNDRANVAFLGSRKDIWHRMGQEMAEGMSVDDWASAAGLGWTANIVPAYVKRDYQTAEVGGYEAVDNVNFNVRSDTGHVLGVMSDRYQNVQPRDVLEWFERYISVDDRFKLDVAGSLGQGETIWATAVFNGGMQVAGENHTARLLMSTTFDGSGSTTNQATMTRVVCNNTLNVAHGDKRAVIRTRHSTAFQPAKVAKELATIAQSFEVYKLMGDALAQAEMSREQVMNFFKDCLDIKRDAKPDDISTRKQNQYREVAASYRKSIEEGAPESSAWACLQAITRYVDHDRSSRGGESEDSARFASANFGSGSALKGEAMGLLMPLIRDRVPVLA